MENTTTPEGGWEKEWDKFKEQTATFASEDGEEFNVSWDELSFVDELKAFIDRTIKQAVAVREGEVIKRRNGEILLMMDECERKGWDFNRFIATFAALINNSDK